MKKMVFIVLMGIGLMLSASDVKSEKMLHQDILIKSEVETALSMLQAIYSKHQRGEMTLTEAKNLGTDLLRELRYGSEGYFWADTTEGVNVVLYGKKEIEGKRRLENRDKNGVYYIKEMRSRAEEGGGYVEYWFPEMGENRSHSKRSYVLLFKPFEWVVGSGYYRDIKVQDIRPIDREAFVKRGADLIAEQGEKSFDLFRERGSEWFKDNRYLFVWDMNGIRYVYPPDAEGEGKQVRDLKDVDNKPIGELLIKIAASKEAAGWMHYRWAKPGELVPSWKSTYVMKVHSPSGKVFIIGSGAYDMPPQKSFAVAAVNNAVKLIEKEGLKAFDMFRDKRSQYLYQDTYVFVIAEDGIELVNAAFPKLEGRNVIDYKDADGNYFVKEFINVAKSRGHGWVNYPWPKPGDVEKLPKSTYVRKVMVDGKMVVVCAGLYLD